MDSAMEFMKNLSGNITGGINNCMMGKIEKFDGGTMKADVVPLGRVKNKAEELEEVSMLIEVPVSFLKAGPFVVRPPYKKGDIVLVVFADSDTENILLSGDISNPNSTRSHSLDDAIVVGGIMPFTTNLPSEHLDDLIIAKDDFTSKIVIKEDGTIEVSTDNKIDIIANSDINVKSDSNVIVTAPSVQLGSSGASQGIPLGEDLKAWLDSHTHPYSWTDPGGSGFTSPPSASPPPSKAVKSI